MRHGCSGLERLPKTIAVVGLVAAVILGLTFIKKDFNLEAEGTLMPRAAT